MFGTSNTADGITSIGEHVFRNSVTEADVLPVTIATVVKKANLKKVVDETLRELEASGKAEALYEHWFGQQSALKMSKREFKIDTDKID